MILAIDPGREKCGLAVAGEKGELLERRVVSRQALREAVGRYRAEKIIIGASAFGRAVARELDSRAEIVFVPENDSSWLARQRYWRENPPRGWWKLVPTSLRVPPQPVDDLAATILLERYLKTA